MSRIGINDLQVPEKVLSQKEMGEVVGGSIRYRRWNRYRYATSYRYRYVTTRRRVRVAQRVRYVQSNLTATGTNYGSWRRG